jgi:molecular chaperone HtpG
MKEGTSMDFLNRDKLIELFRFNSSNCDDSEGIVSLKEYTERFVEGQKEIFYISGQDRASVEQSPHLEIFKKKGIEVLYLTDPMDDIVFSSMPRFGEYDIKSVDQANLDSVKEIKKDEEDVKVEDKEGDSEFNEFASFVKTTLGEKVKDVVKSSRLSDSPCILVNADGSASSHIQNVMKMMDKNYTVAAKVLELNADHAMVKNLAEIYKKSPQEEFLKEALFQLFETSMFQEGVVLDPKETVPRIFRTLEKASGWYLDINKK